MIPSKIIIIMAMLIFLIACKKDKHVDFPNCSLNWKDSSYKHPQNNKLNALLEQITKQGYPGVAISVMDSINGLWVGSKGFSCIETNDKLDACAVHHSASLSKNYIATAILLLHSTGKLNINEKAKIYITETINELDNFEDCTVANLLNHSSGIYDFNENPNLYADAINDPYSIKSWRDHINKYAKDKKAYFNCGEAVRYSNTNYLLLGLIIENITNMSINEAIEELIFKPYGLEESGFFKKEYAKQTSLTNNYFEHFNNVIQNGTDIQNHFASISKGHEGVVASAKDFVEYFYLLNNGKILDGNTLGIMKQFVQSSESGVKYGTGIMEFSTPIGNVQGHTGNAFGCMTFLYYLPAKKRCVFFATNVGGRFNNNLKDKLFNEVRDNVLNSVNF